MCTSVSKNAFSCVGDNHHVAANNTQHIVQTRGISIYGAFVDLKEPSSPDVAVYTVILTYFTSNPVAGVDGSFKSRNSISHYSRVFDYN
jgi:hypothetical protein